MESILESLVDQEEERREYVNPLYLDYRGSKLRYQKNKVLKQSGLWIVCLGNDLDKDLDLLRDELYRKETEIEGYISVLNIVKMPEELLSMNSVRLGLIKIPKEIIEQFEKSENDTHIAYLMLDCSTSMVNVWLKSREEKTLEEFINQKVMARYSQSVKESEPGLIEAIKQFGDTYYWKLSKNCRAGENGGKYRSFFSGVGEHYKNLYSRVVSKLRIEFKDHGSCYPNDEEEVEKSVKPYFYRPAKEEEMLTSLSQVKSLLTTGVCSYKEKYYLICYLMISRKYCHYLFDHSIFPIFLQYAEKYQELFRYLLGYMWGVMLREQKSVKRIAYSQKPIYLDIGTVSKLPTFDVNPNVPYLSPYYIPFTLLPTDRIEPVSRDGIKPEIVDMKEMKRRINLFVSKRSDFDLFEGADWSKMAISGSAMAATLPKYSPLMYNCGYCGEEEVSDDVLIRFFERHYPGSDIDMACEFDDYFSFVDHLLKLRDVITKNSKSETKIKTIKTVTVYVSERVGKVFCESNKIPYTWEYVLEHRHDADVKLFFYEMYLAEKQKVNPANKEILGDLIKTHPYTDFVNFAPIESLFVNINSYEPFLNTNNERNNGMIFCHHIKGDEEGDVIVVRECFRYKIDVPSLGKEFEIFNCGTSLADTILNFHLPCVRAYYQGDNCYITPAAISSYLTGINLDYNYYNASRDPFEILHKYHARGYGFCLDKNEGRLFQEYVRIHPRMKERYGETVFGRRELDDKLYGENETVTVNEIKYKYYKWYSTIGATKHYLNTVNKKGQIYPVDVTLIDKMF